MNAPISTSQEDAEFLTKIRDDNLNLSKLLMAAPARLLTASIDEVDLPVRFTSRVKQENVKTVAGLLSLSSDLRGKNLGTRTLEVATENLKKFFVKKIQQKKLVTLRQMMEDFGSELMSREQRIWEMRTGLNGERFTLEAIGDKFGLTRERVRQIESAMFTLFGKKYFATKLVSTMVRDGMTYAQLVSSTGVLLTYTDPLPITALLESLEPKMYFVNVGTEPIISSSPRTELTTTFKQTVNMAEQLFRRSEVLMSKDNFLAAMESTDADETSKQMAIATVMKDGRWMDGHLISPNADKVNVAIGCLQASPRPIHLDQLAEDVKSLCGEETTAEALRSAFSFVPTVRSFGYGLVGFSRHIGMNEKEISAIIHFCESVVTRGQEGFQWNTKDLLAKLHARHPEITIAHHELNVILQSSQKLAYLGRLTWILKSEHNVERKYYKTLFASVLEKAGKPLPEDTLLQRVNKQRGIHLSVHLRHDSHFLEVAPKIWGLTIRDNPFSAKEVKHLAALFDETFHNGQEFTNEYLDNNKVDRKGVKATEIMKIVELVD